MRGDELELKVRLGDQPGQIQLNQPATNTFVRYRYLYDEESLQIRLFYESNLAGEGNLSVLLPRGKTVSSVSVDEEEHAFFTERFREDRYVELATDWAAHELRVQLK